MTEGRKRLLDGLILAGLLLLVLGIGLAVALRYQARQQEAAIWETLYALRSAQIAYREDPHRGNGQYAASLDRLGFKTPGAELRLLTNETYSEAQRGGTSALRLYHNGTRDDTITP